MTISGIVRRLAQCHRAPVILLSLCIGGCISYKPMPLTRAAIDAALTLPPEQTLRLRAERQHNDLIPRQTINLSDGISPDEAAILAVVVTPALRAERNRLALSQAQLLQAGILPNPQLSANLDPVTGGATAGTNAGFGITGNWEITALITHDARVAAARAAHQSVRLDVAWKEWQAAQAARLAVYDLRALQLQRDAAQEIDKLLADNRANVRRAVEQHLQTIVEGAAAEAASQDAHATLLAAERDLLHQEFALRRAVGFPADTVVRIEPDLALPSHLDLPAANAMLEGLEERRLDLVALRRGYDSQEQAVRAAVLAQFPKITLGITRATDTTNVHTLGPNAVIDLPIFDRNQGNIAIETATRQKLYDEYIDRVYTARSDVLAARDEIEAINRQIAAAEEALPSQQRLVETYRMALRAHSVDVLNFYTARTDLTRQRLGLLKLKQQLMQSEIALEIAAGRYLQQPPATKPTTTAPTSPVAAEPPPPAPTNGPTTAPATGPARGPATGPASPETQP